MIYLMIRQKVRPGKRGECERACAESVRIWQKHGCVVIGPWTNWIGGDVDEVIYILPFKDFAEYQDIDTKAHDDPDWTSFLRMIGEGSMGRSTELFRPVAHSTPQQ
ncbi:NIPSNAP family protein [Chloroflexota bacterium]